MLPVHSATLGTITASQARGAPRGHYSSVPVIAAALVASLAIGFARRGLSASMTEDDLMNIYQALRKPLGRLIFEKFAFFTSGYRPLGNLLYRLLYSVFGLTALPYRIFCFSLILFNLYVLYRTAAAIASREAALLAALIASYNAGFADLYYNTGTLYDLLCYTFYFLALGLYAGVRARGQCLSRGGLAAFLALYICALNAKEMAVSMPLILLAFELTMGRPSSKILQRWTPVIAATVVAIPYAIGKLSGDSPFLGNDAYRVHLGLPIYFRAFGHYTALLSGLPIDGLNVAAWVLLVALLGTIALLGDRPQLSFLFLFTVISPLPVIFVEPRGPYAVYVPTFGFALFAALVIIQSRRGLARRIAGQRRLTRQTRQILAMDTFLICLTVLMIFHLSRPLPKAGERDAAI